MGNATARSSDDEHAVALDDDLMQADGQILSAREAYRQKIMKRKSGAKPKKPKPEPPLYVPSYEETARESERHSGNPFKNEYTDWTIGSGADEEVVEERHEEQDYSDPLGELPNDYAGWTIGPRADAAPPCDYDPYEEDEMSETMRRRRQETVLPRIPYPRKKLTVGKKTKKKKKKKKKPKHKQKQEKVPGFRGVHCRTSLDGGQKYFSLVSIKGKKIYIGSFDTPEECALEYDKLILKARDHVPPHKLNFPERLHEHYPF